MRCINIEKSSLKQQAINAKKRKLPVLVSSFVAKSNENQLNVMFATKNLNYKFWSGNKWYCGSKEAKVPAKDKHGHTLLVTCNITEKEKGNIEIQVKRRNNGEVIHTFEGDSHDYISKTKKINYQDSNVNNHHHHHHHNDNNDNNNIYVHDNHDNTGSSGSGNSVDYKVVHNLTACTSIRGDTLSLQLLPQWIIYHKMVGVSQFLVYVTHRPVKRVAQVLNSYNLQVKINKY
eukprot:Pgem_evm1s7622